MAGSKNTNGETNYSNFWFDPGIAQKNWRQWHYVESTSKDPGGVAFIFNTPPMAKADFLATTGLQFGLNANIATKFANIFATDATYVEAVRTVASSLSPCALAKRVGIRCCHMAR